MRINELTRNLINLNKFLHSSNIEGYFINELD